MEFTLVSLFFISIVLSIIIFLLFFGIKSLQVYHDLKDNFFRILLGSFVSGIGLGAILGLFLCCVLPTHYYILKSTPEGYIIRYVLDGKFINECGRTYIVNQIDEDCYFCAMSYGDASYNDLEEPIVPLTKGCIVEIKHEIDGRFTSFPLQISSENKGGYRWHVLTRDQVISEYN